MVKWPKYKNQPVKCVARAQWDLSTWLLSLSRAL